MTYYFIDDFNNICRQKDGMDKDFSEVIDLVDLINDINKLAKKNKELKYHLNRTEKELNEYKGFMSLG